MRRSSSPETSEDERAETREEERAETREEEREDAAGHSLPELGVSEGRPRAWLLGWDEVMRNPRLRGRAPDIAPDMMERRPLGPVGVCRL